MRLPQGRAPRSRTASAPARCECRSSWAEACGARGARRAGRAAGTRAGGGRGRDRPRVRLDAGASARSQTWLQLAVGLTQPRARLHVAVPRAIRVTRIVVYSYSASQPSPSTLGAEHVRTPWAVGHWAMPLTISRHDEPSQLLRLGVLSDGVRLSVRRDSRHCQARPCHCQHSSARHLLVAARLRALSEGRRTIRRADPSLPSSGPCCLGPS